MGDILCVKKDILRRICSLHMAHSNRRAAELTCLASLPELAHPVAAGSGSLARAGSPLAELPASLSSQPAPSFRPLCPLSPPPLHP